MKKLIVVALLMSLNLYTMDTAFKSKPYKKYLDQLSQIIDMGQEDYNDIKEILKPLKKNRTNQPGCLTGLINAVSRALAFRRNYINS